MADPKPTLREVIQDDELALIRAAFLKHAKKSFSEVCDVGLSASGFSNLFDGMSPIRLLWPPL